MNYNAKKRCITIILIFIALISLAAACYIFKITEEEYQLERAFGHWLDGVYGKRKLGLPPGGIMLIWLKRMAGIVIAAVSLGIAVLINSVRRKTSVSDNESMTVICPNCSAGVRACDKFCPECGSPLK